MPAKTATEEVNGLQGLMDTVLKTEKSALDSMHRFADTCNDAFPDLGEEGDGPRKKIIDSAFKMTGDVIDSGHRMACNVIDITEDAIRNLSKKAEATVS